MARKEHKYIFVIGGVMSGVGKGIATSSIGKILQSKGFKVNLIKVDPYLNVDAGTMNPTEHGEVFVLRSGLETDQDMGNYERFLGKDLTDEDYITSGMVYNHVIQKERSLGYRGKCVEAIPHIRDEITRRFTRAADVNGSEISVIEIGGTIGDYQNIMFIEAARVLKVENPDDVLFIMVSYLPIPGKLGEMKTKPTQNAIRALNSYGVQPDIIIARSEVALDKRRKEKIATSCSVKSEHVISAPDIKSIYEVPLNFERDNLGNTILELLKSQQKSRKANFAKWRSFVSKVNAKKPKIKIAVVGKYFDTGDFVLSDAYISVIEAIKFSSYKLGVEPEIHWLNAKDFEKKSKTNELKKYHGVLVPGGFGERGIDGKLNAIRYVRENKIPYFGLCYGMQLMVIEYARNALGIKGAQTHEIDPKAKDLVVDIMPDQKKKLEKEDYGGTMRLGVYPAYLKRGTIARKSYGKELIEERHRHRYEVNPDYVERLASKDLVFSGVSPDKVLMEIAELPEGKHPFFLGVQFHPELQARPLEPHPLFTAFIKAAISRSKKRKK
ncbi:MAG: CTP synthase [Candidatus Pacebacteria bacterium]|jgi:CTP synthase|nr:CTP synthetase [bacterium]MDP6527942.1 CTP synthase [Candidatus Paceibacterota bacterium]MDP6659474.1 CTP synthase [Candidatus Paceibacterota bacterium]|tara:strand:+ start:3281 stop:4939 length:1659 start_codon:yes stop_codon:yes gene_type:complete